MGGWYLEAFRMGIYVSFPVIAFYMFNQPHLFEKWVIQTKQESFPPESKSHPQEIQQAIADFQRQRHEKMMQQLAPEQQQQQQNAQK